MSSEVSPGLAEERSRSWPGSSMPASRSSVYTSSGGDLSAGQPAQGERRESATDVRLDGDEMTADADDGDPGHASAAYIILSTRGHRSFSARSWNTRSSVAVCSA